MMMPKDCPAQMGLIYRIRLMKPKSRWDKCNTAGSKRTKNTALHLSHRS